MFKKILIANRGEIACRIIRTARRLGIATVAVYSDDDRDALHVREADEAVAIGPAPASQSYLSIEKILAAAKESGAEAIHPGYGFLSENGRFAETVVSQGIAFIGPPAAAINAMGDKIASKRIAVAAGVSTVLGHPDAVADADAAITVARQIGFPVMIKASAGGGGKGMRVARSEGEVREAFSASRNEALSAFGDDRIFLEKFVSEPRHVEIQILADSHGNCVFLGERECSIQRRNQKVIEEAPSPFLDERTRRAMGEQAVALARSVGYQSAGTVEFIVDGARNFYFLEMNTRLQVEHPVTELVTGVDLVEEMIRVAAGEALRFTQAGVRLNGWAIEGRLYAEDPYRNFLPSIGRLTRYRPPAEGKRANGTIVRNDTGVYEGAEISTHYDPMIAKLCTWAPDRPAAIAAMSDALDRFEVEGVGNNLMFLSAVMNHPRFGEGRLTTAFIDEEYPDGFRGPAPSADEARDLAAVAVFVNLRSVQRDGKISGALANHIAPIARDWVLRTGDDEIAVEIVEDDASGVTVALADGARLRVASDWLPGRTLATFTIDGRELGVKIARVGPGWRLRWRGMDLRAHVRRPRVAELARLLPRKSPPDTSKVLLCPMPGVVIAIHVGKGDTVEHGQALAVVEAMKMENTLRAERHGVVKRVAVNVGARLAVDEIIMEFD